MQNSFWTPARKSLGLGFLGWVAIGLAAFTSGYVEPGRHGHGLTVAETFYLMMQIVLTVGYGDLTPVTDFGMLFTSLYVLSSGLLMSGLICEGVDYFVRVSRANTERLLQTFLDNGKNAPQTWLERNQRIILASFVFLVGLVMWTVFFMFWCEQAYGSKVVECEGLPFVKSFYFSVISISTVGFGDITPKTQGGDVFATVGLFIGFGTYANLVGAITDRIQNVKQYMHMHTIEETELSAADENNDKQVDLYEFTRFILARYDLVAPEILDRIAKNFKELDVDGSGHLTTADVKLLCQRHAINRHAHHRRAPPGEAHASVASKAEYGPMLSTE